MQAIPRRAQYAQRIAPQLFQQNAGVRPFFDERAQ